jgi:transcription-repair coupling factor (superfamily II helicase)
MRDLEMRGAGELLGIRQHGYIASVGFHLYTRLLSQSVRTIREGKGLPITLDTQPGFRQIRFPVSVDLPISVGIPVDYVPDQNMRLRLYRRLADLESEEDINPMQEEFTDRFGPPPLAMRNLFFQLQLKLRAEAAGLSSISVEGEQIVLRFPSLPEGVGTRNLPELGGQIRSGKNAYWMPMPPEPEVWRPALLASLTEIARNCQPF